MKYFLILFLTLSGIPASVYATPGEVAVGSVLHEAPMDGLTGNSTMLSAYRGKPLIINIWASYCPPCLAEMGSLERLWKRYGKQFNIIGISIDDYRDRANGFLDKAKTTFPHYIDHDLKLENMFGADSIPLTVFVDAQGRVLQKVRGAREWDGPNTIKAIGQTFNIKM